MRSPVGGGGGGPLHVGTPPNPQPISVSPEIGSMMAKSDQNSPPSSLLSTSGPPPDMKMVCVCVCVCVGLGLGLGLCLCLYL